MVCFYKLREGFCGNLCGAPLRIDPLAGVAVSDANGRCEISIGVQGGSEAYAIRGRPISRGQVQHCWDVLEDSKSPSELDLTLAVP
ncbi:MAG: hypothetical protein M1813_002391 [Trichoglossum hirsutum]|nr:MAG: hypothetical protein M1813_002391 [Trichoglossum hirsutum]